MSEILQSKALAIENWGFVREVGKGFEENWGDEMR